MKPLLIGSYLLDKNMTSKYYEPDFKQLKIKQTPYLFPYDYILFDSEFITHSSITITVLFNQTKPDKQYLNMHYILTEKSNKLSTIYRVNDSDYKIEPFNLLRAYKITFKLNNLKENTSYQIRIWDKYEKRNSSISTLSNSISFKTLPKSVIKLKKIDDNLVVFDIKLKCNFNLNDSSIDDFKITRRLDHYVICNSINITLEATVCVILYFIIIFFSLKKFLIF